MNEFYVHLSSNSDVFLLNTPDCFTVQLAKPVVLEGNWSLALTEIDFPIDYEVIFERTDLSFTIETVSLEQDPPKESVTKVVLNRPFHKYPVFDNNNEKVLELEIVDGQDLWVHVNVGNVATISSDEFSGLPSSPLKKKSPPYIYTIKPDKLHLKKWRVEVKIKLSPTFSRKTNRILKELKLNTVESGFRSALPENTQISQGRVHIGPHTKLLLSDALKHVLNFHTNILLENESYSFSFKDPREFNTFYILSDLVMEQFSKEQMLPLLRTCDKSQVFLKPYYLPLARNLFQSITLYIKTDTGFNLLFKGEKPTRAVLHFKKNDNASIPNKH